MRHVRSTLVALLLFAVGMLVAWLLTRRGDGWRLPPDVVVLDEATRLPSERSAWEQTVARLETPVTIRFDNVALADAAAQLAAAAGLPVAVWPGEMDLAGLDPEATATLSFADVPLDVAMSSLLGEPSDLMWGVTPAGVVRVPADDGTRVLRLYRVDDLMRRAAEQAKAFDHDEPKAGEPPIGSEAWAQEALESTLRDLADVNRRAVRFNYFAGRFGIRATAAEHDRLQATLGQLREGIE